MGQKSLTWIRLITICYIVSWWPSCQSDLIAFSNSESDVVWRVSRLPLWPPSWILELNDAAILNLHVTSMPPIKFWLNLTYGLGSDVIWRISRWLPWRPSWILEWNDFSNSESLSHSDASHQVSAQSDLRFGSRCCLKNFKMAAMAASLDIRMEILAILNLHVATKPSTKFHLNRTYHSGGDVKNMKG